MKILYNVSTGVVITTNADFCVPGQGEALAEGNFMEMTQAPYYYKYNGSFVTPRGEDEVASELAVKNFSFESFVGTLFQKLPFNRVKDLGVQTGTLEWLVTWKNWTGISAFFNLLLADQTITPEEAVIIKDCFLLQGINLDNYAAPPA
jgi:hypothetical protein